MDFLELEIEEESEQAPGQATASEEPTSNDGEDAPTISDSSVEGDDDSLSEAEAESLPEYDNLPTGQSTVARPKKNLRGHRTQPRLAVPVEGSGAPAPTPTNYKVVPDYDSSCGAGLPCDSICNDKTSLANLLEPVVEISTSNPNMNVNPPACEVSNCDGKGSVERKTWGIPML